MANLKKRKTGLNKVIKKKTSVDICGDNLIIFSINDDLENINYLIKKKDLKKFLLLIKQLFKNKMLSYKNVEDVLEEEIYKIYQTKVAQRKISIILLNILVLEGFLNSNDGVDYKVIGNNFSDIISKYTM